jgi:hypothetical protein
MKILMICIVVGSLNLLETGNAAERQRPPLESTRSPLVHFDAGVLSSVKAEPPTLIFTNVQALQNSESKDSVTVLVEREILGDVMQGGHYLFAYFDTFEVAGRPGVFVRDPNRAQLLSLPGAEPVLFLDNIENRALVGEQQEVRERNAGYLQTVLSGLTSDDPQLADLWSAELTLRSDLLARLSDTQRDTIKSRVADESLFPATRARLLYVCARSADAYGANWLTDRAAKIISTEAVFTVRGARNRAELTFAAFDVLDRYPQIAIPVESLSRWLQGDNAGLAERALLALRQRQPDAERALIQRALAQTFLNTDVRTFLIDHLRRLEIMLQAQQ